MANKESLSPCAKERNSESKESKNTYNKRKSNRECVTCGRKLPDNYAHVKCEKCSKLDSETAKYARNVARKNGICTICQVRKARPNRKTCEICGGKIAALARARRERLGEAGLCMMCGKVPRSKTSVYCDGCKERRKEYNRW